MPDLPAMDFDKLGAFALVLVLGAWVLKPFFASWSTTHARLVDDVSETNKKNAETNQKLAVNQEQTQRSIEQQNRHFELAHIKLDKLLERKP